jgi:quercetin dioxygenase-like cupin family protein
MHFIYVSGHTSIKCIKGAIFMKATTATNILLSIALLATVVLSQDEVPGEADTRIVPDKERQIAEGLNAEGPTETHGIESSVVLGTMALDGEFDGLEGHVLRAREVTVLPGGQVAVHQHTSRPGVAYVLEGEAVEHRQGLEDPIAHSKGSTAFEKTGTIHWWENESQEVVRVLVVDIVPAGTK